MFADEVMYIYEKGTMKGNPPLGGEGVITQTRTEHRCACSEGFDKVSYLGVSQRSGAVRQGCKVTFLSDVAEGVFVHRHNQ